MKENRWTIDHLIIGSSATIIVSYTLLLSLLINNESTIMLVIFNLLFVSLTFPLDGTLSRKTAMLLIGNAIGLVCNYLFLLLSYAGVYYIGETSNIMYMLVSPLANLVWIVSFWSISLTVLIGSKNKRRRAET
jgi:hypothetical protein